MVIGKTVVRVSLVVACSSGALVGFSASAQAAPVPTPETLHLTGVLPGAVPAEPTLPGCLVATTNPCPTWYWMASSGQFLREHAGQYANAKQADAKFAEIRADVARFPGATYHFDTMRVNKRTYRLKILNISLDEAVTPSGAQPYKKIVLAQQTNRTCGPTRGLVARGDVEPACSKWSKTRLFGFIMARQTLAPFPKAFDKSLPTEMHKLVSHGKGHPLAGPFGLAVPTSPKN